MAATGFTSLGIAGAVTQGGINYGDLSNLYRSSSKTQTPGNTFAGFYTRSSAGQNIDLYNNYPRRQQWQPKNAPQTGFYTMQPDGSFNDVNDTIIMPKIDNMTDLSGNVGLSRVSTNFVGSVYTIFAVDSSNVYVGGNFQKDVGVANCLARWDGAKFSPWLSNDTDTGVLGGFVSSIHGTSASNIYIGGGFGGYFPSPGAASACILKWDGTAFRSLGYTFNLWSGNVNATVYAIFALDPSNVYIGGNFQGLNNDIGFNNVARWNGSIFNKMSTGLGDKNSTIRTIYAYDTSNVYFGGDFINAGGNAGITFSNIARWNGSSFVAMPSTGGPGFHQRMTPSMINTIYAHDTSHVYIGGGFTAAASTGSTVLNQITMWNGSQFTKMNEGVQTSFSGVQSIFALDLSNVYIGGGFTRLFGESSFTMGRFAKWDGTKYNSFLSAVNPNSSKIAYPGFQGTPVYSIYVSKTDVSNVYIGGSITNTQVPGSTFNSIARLMY